MNSPFKGQKNGVKRGGGGAMGGKREKNATRYPWSPIPFPPFFRRARAFPFVPFTKLSTGIWMEKWANRKSAGVSENSGTYEAWQWHGNIHSTALLLHHLLTDQVRREHPSPRAQQWSVSAAPESELCERLIYLLPVAGGSSAQLVARARRACAPPYCGPFIYWA